MRQYWLVFDVESVGLHGEGFAVGYVLINKEGDRLREGFYWCLINKAHGDEDGFNWCLKNMSWLGLKSNCKDPVGVRQRFLLDLISIRQSFPRVILAADCPFPVEVNFLIAMMKDSKRYDLSPYPLIDIASWRMARGHDPLAIEPRLADEGPIHHPLMDARQSARLFLNG